MDQLPFLIALGAVGLMGFANQRGGTCTVAAIGEIMDKRRFHSFAALLDASLWVAAGMILLNSVHILPPLPNGYAVSLTTIAGGVLFGLGAFVNRACIFGSVARLGSGQWAYLATPVGFYLGALLTRDLPAPAVLPGTPPLLHAPLWLGVILGMVLLARLMHLLWRIAQSERAGRDAFWSPHAATTVMGLAFLVALIAFGAWTYSDAMIDLAHGSHHHLRERVWLNLALLVGAMIGGWAAGCLRMELPSLKTSLRTFGGGAIMGIGSSLIPGGNTGLVLIGMPLLEPHAWVAFITICLTIYAAIRLSRALQNVQKRRVALGG